MNVWKKIGALTFVIALAMSFCVMAGATALPAGNPTAKNDSGLTELTFTVQLTASTPRPGTKFTYTITDNSNNAENSPVVTFKETQTDTQVVRDATDTKKATVTFGVDTTGTASTATVQLAIAPTTTVLSTTSEYTITQTALSANAVAAGFSSGATNNADVVYTLKLAVNGTNVTQAVLLDDAQTPNKVAGFMNNTYTAAQAVEINKYVASAGVGKGDFFDFSIVIPASSTDDVYMVGLPITLNTEGDANKDGSKTGFQNTTTKELTSGDNNLSGVIKADDGGNAASVSATNDSAYKLTISNLPGNVTVTVTEATPDGYTVQTAVKSASAYANLAAKSGTLSETVTTSLTNAVGVKFVNVLADISLTGVTLRYAPYLLTLGAGITVLPLSRRYKKREEEV